jgi:hypothetical protein
MRGGIPNDPAMPQLKAVASIEEAVVDQAVAIAALGRRCHERHARLLVHSQALHTRSDFCLTLNYDIKAAYHVGL